MDAQVGPAPGKGTWSQPPPSGPYTSQRLKALGRHTRGRSHWFSVGGWDGRMGKGEVSWSRSSVLATEMKREVYFSFVLWRGWMGLWRSVYLYYLRMETRQHVVRR